MGHSHHKIKVSIIEDGCKVNFRFIPTGDWLDGWLLPTFVSGTKAFSSKSIEQLYQGSCDSYGNKEVIHSYIAGDVTIVPKNFWDCLTGISHTVRTYSENHNIPCTWSEHFFDGENFSAGPVCTGLGQRSSNTIEHSVHAATYGGGKYKWVIAADYGNRAVIERYRAPVAKWSSKAEECEYAPYYLEFSSDVKVQYCTATFSAKTAKWDLSSSVYPLTRGYLNTFMAAPNMMPNMAKSMRDSINTNGVNNIANLNDLRDLSGFIPQLCKAKSWLGTTCKTVADFFLWWKYSMSTSKSDVEDMASYIANAIYDKHACQRAATMSTLEFSNRLMSGERTYRQSVSYRAPAQSLFEMAGINPTNMSTYWDLIPFSFLVDWFTNLGSCFDSLDHMDFSLQCDVLSSVASTKTTCTCYELASEQFPVIGELHYSAYERYVDWPISPEIPQVELHKPSTSVGGVGTALVVSIL